MKNGNNSRGDCQEGVVLPIVALSLLAFLMCAGLAVDTFTMYTANRQQITNAELAAMAALHEFNSSGDAAIAEKRAATVLTLNKFISKSAAGLSGSVEFGEFDGARFIPASPTLNAVKVTVSSNANGGIHLFFAGLLGSAPDMTVSGVAYSASGAVVAVS